MPLLKRKKKDEEGWVPASAGAGEATPTESGPAEGAPLDSDAGDSMRAEAAAQPAAQAVPPPRPRSNGGAQGGLVGRLYGPPGEQSAEERQRVAEAEFRAAIAPAMDLLVASVPDAGSPEEAARRLEDNLGDYPPDTGPGAFVHGDAFDADARVYYRLLKRDYERSPRPSEQRRKSHHLHERYGLLPGHKGW